MDDIIIWGAGKATTKRYEWAVFAGYSVLFFVDNNPDTWGGNINGIPICSPERIKGHKCTVLTSDMYFKEIEAQLGEMAYNGRQIGFRLFKKEAVCRGCKNVDFTNVDIGEKVTFIFDAYFPGMNWGGTEEWSCKVANKISELGIRTQMICGMNGKFDKFTNNCLHFDVDEDINMIKKMAQKIAEHLPCVFISYSSIAVYAARLVKTIFPDKVKIVLVSHNDEIHVYEALKFWSDSVDKIICISKKIFREFQERYALKNDILEYHPNPVLVPEIFNKRIVKKGTLKVGFAARLEKIQKRTNLVPEIIEACIRKSIDIEFNIVGEGDCLDLIRKYVFDNRLERYVHVLGWIPPTDMEDFWKDQDIYLNISEYEGMSLAMLEAMVCGVVPVVTDVSGVRDVIEDGKNGFVVSVDNWLETADKIAILNNNRELLCKAGVYNMQLIREKCNIDDYARWVIDTFNAGF